MKKFLLKKIIYTDKKKFLLINKLHVLKKNKKQLIS